MADLVTALFCQRSLTDSDKNSVSAIEIIEGMEVNGPSFPDIVTLPATGEVITIWMRSDINIPEKSFCRAFLSDPKGDHERKAELSIDLSKSNFCRSHFRLSSIELRGEGKYEFHIEKKSNDDQWELVTKVPFLVVYKIDKTNPKKSKEEK